MRMVDNDAFGSKEAQSENHFNLNLLEMKHLDELNLRQKSLYRITDAQSDINLYSKYVGPPLAIV